MLVYQQPKSRPRRHGTADAVNNLQLSMDSPLPDRLNLLGAEGRTPLNMAMLFNNIAVAQFLIQAGADMHIADVHSRTPLFYAFVHGTLKFMHTPFRPIRFP